MTKWEYMSFPLGTLQDDADEEQGVMDTYGEVGWECYAVTSH